MKRLFNVSLLMAAMVAMIACGGNSQKKAAETTTNPIDEKVALAMQMMEAAENGDFEKAVELEEQIDKWYETLSAAEQAQFENALEAAIYGVAETADDEDYDEEYDDEFGYTDEEPDFSEDESYDE